MHSRRWHANASKDESGGRERERDERASESERERERESKRARERESERARERESERARERPKQSFTPFDSSFCGLLHSQIECQKRPTTVSKET